MSIFHTVKQAVMKKPRSAKLDHFYSLCDASSNVLDVGIACIENNDSVNIFLNNFRLKSEQYTGLAVEPMNEIRKNTQKKTCYVPRWDISF